jgi:RNA polymerase sigma-70 factor (ECF subfamily)
MTPSASRDRWRGTPSRHGDEEAFQRLIERQRGALHSHCYRMLWSVHDAEDAVQETMLRAWRALPGYQGRSPLKNWLHRIATNVCIDAIHRTTKCVPPIAHRSPTDPGARAPREPVRERASIEPYGDRELGVEDGWTAPQASYERRESVELAFTAAVQHLPARQRAVLILRDVLGFSAKEAAAILEATVVSINSALQRARTVVDERVPEQSHVATMPAHGDPRIREAVGKYVDAMERDDVVAVVEMLAEEVAT